MHKTSVFNLEIMESGSNVPRDILNWVISKMVIIINFERALPMCGFIAQLVEHRTGMAEVTGSNPVEALIFSGFFVPIA